MDYSFKSLLHRRRTGKNEAAGRSLPTPDLVEPVNTVKCLFLA